MRFLIVGCGHVGNYLYHHLPESVLWPGKLADITPEVIDGLQSDVVINAAGKTDLAWCEQHRLETRQINAYAPDDLLQIVLKCHKRVRLIHISSGCIWQGPYDSDGKPFSPNSSPTPACYYAMAKAEAERLLMECPGMLRRYFTILRPRQIYSPELSPRNTLYKLLKYPKLIDTPNSMTSIDTLLNTITAVSELSLVFDSPLNVSDAGWTTPYKVGVMLAEAGLRDMPQIMSKDELDSWHKPKRVDVVMQDELFDSLFCPPPVEE